MHRQLLDDHPWVSENCDPMPITEDQVEVLRSWYNRLHKAVRTANRIDDVVDAYGHLQGACTDVEVEISHVLRRFGRSKGLTA